MNNSILFVISLLLLSCNQTNKTDKIDKIDRLLKNNHALIVNEIYETERIVMTNPAKAMPFYVLSKRIFDKYKIIYENFHNNITTDSLILDLLNELYEIEIFHIDNYEIQYLKGLQRNYITISYLQTQTLYCIKTLKEYISVTDYATNICFIEPIKIGDEVKIIVSKLDTTVVQNIMIGKLHETKNVFIDSFSSVEFFGGYGIIPYNSLKNKDYIEGLCILPMINGEFDTIRFKSKIYK